MFIWSLIKKNGKAKRNIIISVASLIIMSFLIVIDSDPSDFEENVDENLEDEKAEKEKAEKEKAEKEKAEKEKAEKEKAEKEKAEKEKAEKAEKEKAEKEKAEKEKAEKEKAEKEKEEKEKAEKEKAEKEKAEKEKAEKEKAEKEKTEKEKAEKEKAEKEKAEKEKAEKEKAEKEKSEKEKAEKEKTKKENEKSIDEKIKKYDVVEEAEMDNGELILTYEPGMGWSENSLFYTVYDSFEVTNQAFKDDSVDSVLNLIQGVMVDQKGNEELKDMITYRYTRSDFEELNYSKFKEMAFGQQWRILNEAEGYFIHPGIRVNLKEKYTDNLK